MHSPQEIAAARTNLRVPGELRLEKSQVLGIVVYHLLALLAFVPWFFSWTGVIVAVLGIYVFGVLGINLGYHRLLTHKGFDCPIWLERSLAFLGLCCLQGSPARWVATHRYHHEHADDEPDPHSPIVSFLWAHVGWMLVKNERMQREGLYKSYAKDILRDPFYAWLEGGKTWAWMALAPWALFFFGGFIAGLLLGWSPAVAAQFGLSLWVWGVIVRTVVHWHFTWSVNSVTHIWGYRNYETPDNSRNNAIIAFISNGEGWHNNHHADPRSARHGHKWWEIDVAWLTIRLLQAVGLATQVRGPGSGE
jgi:stearoyl-CoA desaturase (delta-9 desaturase)